MAFRSSDQVIETRSVIQTYNNTLAISYLYLSVTHWNKTKTKLWEVVLPFFENIIGGGDTVRFVRVRLGFYRDKDMFSDKTDIKTDIKTDKTDIENPKVKLQIQGLLQLQKEVIVIIQSQYMDGLQRW